MGKYLDNNISHYSHCKYQAFHYRIILNYSKMDFVPRTSIFLTWGIEHKPKKKKKKAVVQQCFGSGICCQSVTWPYVSLPWRDAADFLQK